MTRFMVLRREAETREGGQHLFMVIDNTKKRSLAACMTREDAEAIVKALDLAERVRQIRIQKSAEVSETHRPTAILGRTRLVGQYQLQGRDS